ncbi:MAG: S-methyl-5-thioribose-1-phosphate isomerase [Deltaproteobacteria bacterium RIFCSPLOWO2_02_FULL_44_10]|nr:MAG: S-methyl-5-thioribose-1-phosphate isomerase [Deltaproteobacteria bacterium RIFCSPHIGHO2_02_FULL_44_16]OGQ45329.1 MAG: S-methyl-5-thioribose-1-phosphate isomerase [Deltaproteobacteria bacterium RIFCSPLOWO2_02_FULL_44_10]
MNLIKTLQWKDDKVILLDQRKLPHEEIYVVCEDYESVAQAIEQMIVRGAPAIGVAAAMGVALGAMGIGVLSKEIFFQKLSGICERLTKTRPTAINLFWGIERMRAIALSLSDPSIDQLILALKNEALKIYHEDIESGQRIGKFGASLLHDGDTVLTHCNAGGLATAGYGTALGVIYAAADAGKTIHVIADETRPRLQGASLTAWELQKHGIDVTVISDNMAASLMRAKKIDNVIVGADRIAANGDTANKIGTYGVAVLASYHKIPFYVAAPFSTIDLTISDGSQIPIEERDHREVTHIGHTQITPTLVNVINPSFDVTPHTLITAIITDRGIVEAPYQETIRNI